MSTPPRRRSVTAVLMRPSGGDALMIEETLAALAREHKVLAPADGKRFDPKEACALALVTRPDLILLVGGYVRLGYSDVSALLDSYEAGARVAVGDRRSLVGRGLRPLTGLAFGIWRNDSGSPVRLYDAAALKEVISHLPAASSQQTLLMSMIEHRLRFSVKEIRLQNAVETPRHEDPVGALTDTVRGLAELMSFRSAARAIR
ncbi:MAG: hypothetical protein OXH20_13595 [bacterium]|nr:hypothetical protein [bacterium]MDE0669258.1 hypothetical protein [bacterium]MXZ30155.1 hypothetical protein [Acidimicrobiia bacterium]MYB25377.1 hypothetical protein [Acidimicrobiia bacterium]MYJ14123.1 hypothetical protein [Acidimicrobiia bacterium]